MSTITRKTFVEQAQQQAIRLSKISDGQEQRLQQAGVNKADLARLDINRDGQVAGAKELSKLFSQVDTFDSNGNADSIQIKPQRGTEPTSSGKVYKALSLVMAEHTQGVEFSPQNSPQRWSEVASDKKILGRGHEGEPVRAMQRKLTRAGFGVQETGVYGPTTESVVQAFQRAHGLPQHGQLDARTAGELEWQEVKGGHKTIYPEATGEVVRKMQRALTEAGFGVRDTGTFGPTTQGQLKKFLESQQMDPERPLDAQVLAALERAGKADPAASTAGMTTSQKYDHYKRLIEQNGGQFKDGPNQRNLLSLRRVNDTDINNGVGVYDDQTIMLWQDANGTKHVQTYESNTEPSAQYRYAQGVDANGDGVKDQGRLPAGYYEYKTSYDPKFGDILLPTSSAMAERDTNHDGLFNDNAYASAGDTILFHSGSTNDTDSAGCQTLPPAEFDRFWTDIRSNGNPGTIGYTLINL